MSANLTVILGAGASVDVVNAKSVEVKNKDFRPPITKNLFKTHGGWESQYDRYPAVAGMVNEIRTALDKDTNQTLEKFLRSLRDSERPHRIAQFLEIPLYLQHYFSEVSDHYCLRPTNYTSLLNKIFDYDIDHTTFLTTNYDLFFDKALSTFPHSGFSMKNLDLKPYISNPKWSYIKLHGSVDWGRNIKKDLIKKEGHGLSDLIENIHSLEGKLDESLEDNIIKYEPNVNELNKFVYPAISVPVGESKLNCDKTHLEHLEERLNECSNFLIIGFSGFDTDILELLDKKEGGFNRVLFVSNSESSAFEARNRFFHYGDLAGKLQMHSDIYKQSGFDKFINDDQIVRGFLANLF